ncbi:unnamed protein product [Oikopleura dioica]|uniref:Connexin N-terminal domain-containing protein n=1 Tax=Oikopleura dioica TaxID=34765 RepID=E4XRG7_OIKDI|nr:unnamed protein product [Oikopleura dioica]
MSWISLDKVSKDFMRDATIFGQLWFLLTILGRVFLLLYIGNPIFGDERKEFRCNTIEFGCENVCFNSLQPVSAHRFWGLQTLVTSFPMMLYATFSLHSRARVTNVKRKGKAEYAKSHRAARMLKVYLVCAVFRTGFETLSYLTFCANYEFPVQAVMVCNETLACKNKIDCYIRKVSNELYRKKAGHLKNH